MTATVSLENVSKTYLSSSREVHAVRAVNLDLMEGEIVSVVGPSGCGKTTLINIIAGFTIPSAGQVRVNGRPPGLARPLPGVVFQSDAVFPWLTVEENVRYGLRYNGSDTSEPSEIVSDYLALTGLADVARNWPRDLSGGMRKRVELARAYAANPPILLLDEPFGALDVMSRAFMQTLLLQVWAKHQKTILCVTHDVEEALFLGHRVAVMTSRPGTLARVFDIPFRFPRSQELKLSAPFISLRRQITASLQERGAIVGAK